jgi:hypothetical protein
MNRFNALYRSWAIPQPAILQQLESQNGGQPFLEESTGIEIFPIRATTL